MENSALITVMASAIDRASKNILRDFHELRFLQSSKKPLDRFLKFAVVGAEKCIFEILNKARPEFSIFSKYADYETDSKSSNCWIINVLDGIENFSRAMPSFSISIAVGKKNIDDTQKIIAGVIYSPSLGELYFAEKGMGAWCQFSGKFQAGFSKTRLRISEKTPSQPIIFTNISQLNEKNADIRMLGSHSISLAYLAAGRGDKAVLRYNDLSDIAAGIIIAEEAGAMVKIDSKLKQLTVQKSF